MYPYEFAYARPSSLAEALHLLSATEGEPKLLAGGQSLLPLLKLRMAEPSHLVDLARVPELRGIREEGNGVVLGASTTYFQAIDNPLVQRRVPLLVQALRTVGDPQVRARGTIGGSLAHADPAGDLPAVALALDAELRASGPSGERRIPARDFFVEMLTTALAADEILTSVRFAATDTPRTGTAYVKHRHPASGYAVVGVAAIVRLAEDGTCAEARLGITGTATFAHRASGAEQALRGRPVEAAACAEACANITDGMEVLTDAYASAEYRAHLTRVLAQRALLRAAGAARGSA